MLRELSSRFPADTRTRGQQYFDAELVRILTATHASVLAEVQGSELHLVSLEVEPRRFSAGCTCAQAGADGSCRHIWAALLEADGLGILPGKSTAGFLVGDNFLDVLDEAYRTRAPLATRGSLHGAGAGEDQPTSRTEPNSRPDSPTPRTWQQHLKALRRAFVVAEEPARVSSWPLGREVLYVLCDRTDPVPPKLLLRVAVRDRRKNGTWGTPKYERIALGALASHPDAVHRRVLTMLQSAREFDPSPASWRTQENAPHTYALDFPAAEILLPLMASTQRLCLESEVDTPGKEPCWLDWDDGLPWELSLAVRAAPEGYLADTCLLRGSERRSLGAARLLVPGGFLVTGTHAARLEDFGALAFAVPGTRREEVRVPAGQLESWLRELKALPAIPRLFLPEEVQISRRCEPPVPTLEIRPDERAWRGGLLSARLYFQYGGVRVAHQHPGTQLLDAEARVQWGRDEAAERAAAETLFRLGARPPSNQDPSPNGAFGLSESSMWKVVSRLVSQGWVVEALGKRYRPARNASFGVRSGLDWFELHGHAEFEGGDATFAQILAALRDGEQRIRLGDGSYGLLPEEWLRRYRTLAALGEPAVDHLKLPRSNVFLLDALLAELPEITLDLDTQKARDEIRRFEGIQPLEAPAGFQGELRDYQREGLGWFSFLERFQLGGCLADDMGLGKTIQVLALLESRRDRGNGGRNDAELGTSLIVVPRSLVFNWKAEAARFTPGLRVLDHGGVGRKTPGAHFGDYDVVLTTYGTLRRDAAEFRQVEFDYVILDESQAIKNPKSVAAKAARLLRGRHRLALSGTPLENHMGELWSLFEFLNPGMLGKSSSFGRRWLPDDLEAAQEGSPPEIGDATGTDPVASPEAEERALLARALRPMILRRTKGQVARELPDRVEQTILCDLDPAQRKFYDSLRTGIRNGLLARVDRDGMHGARMQVLEALLRLRQAACHPGLVSPANADLPSAKLDLLVPRLLEIVEEGHKALVFSQFTTFLGMVRARLEAEGVGYEYLDGKTRDRASRVRRFQDTPGGGLFLISLKAGGLGLNLTGAEYVFLLDPWWNPAVEAQAIDRAHRIGQTRTVFACRLIARDTVEETVLKLQARKRELVQAVLGEDGAGSASRSIGDLTREDLELLLG